MPTADGLASEWMIDATIARISMNECGWGDEQTDSRVEVDDTGRGTISGGDRGRLIRVDDSTGSSSAILSNPLVILSDNSRYCPCPSLLRASLRLGGPTL